jgi:hypothetical protein
MIKVPKILGALSMSVKGMGFRKSKGPAGKVFSGLQGYIGKLIF